MKTFQRYFSSVKEGNAEDLHLPAGDLDHLLAAKFFKDVCKINGDGYEPDTLSGLQRSIQRFLSDGKSPFNILVDEEFEMSRKVLAAKRKSLVQKAGKGNKPNATHAVTDEEKVVSLVLPVLKPSREPCGGFCPSTSALGPEMKVASCFGETWNYYKILQDGREMLFWINEHGTKARKGQENGHKRAFQPKIYATRTDRCPMKFYKLFRNHRPVEMNQPNSPFFVAFRHGSRRENSEIWYMKAPLGKKQIGKLLRERQQTTQAFRE